MRPSLLTSSSANCGTSYAHEILHLFGADDFYFRGRVDGQWGEQLDNDRARFLSGCVMFDSDRPLEDLNIDEQTGQQIGWR